MKRPQMLRIAPRAPASQWTPISRRAGRPDVPGESGAGTSPIFYYECMAPSQAASYRRTRDISVTFSFPKKYLSVLKLSRGGGVPGSFSVGAASR